MVVLSEGRLDSSVCTMDSEIISVFHVHFALYLYSLLVAAFCYYQFYCFQNAASLITDFQNNANVGLLEYITTHFVSLSAQICVATSPLREFIDTLLPWFQYQEWTWLAIG